MSERLRDVTQAWRREAFRGAGTLFALACGCLPVLDVCEQYSVIEQVKVGLQMGAPPEVPGVAWLQVGYFVVVGGAAGMLLARGTGRGRWRLFTAATLLHGVYAWMSGLRPATLVGLGLFAWAFVALQAAEGVGEEDVPQDRPT